MNSISEKKDCSKQAVRLLFGLTTMFFWASEYCHVPYFTPYLRTLSLAASVMGYLVGCYGFTQLLVRIPLGIFADRSGRYKLLVTSGCFFTTVSSLLLFLTTNVPLMFFARVLAGVAASHWVAFTVMFTGYYRPEESGKAIATVNGFNNAGKLLAFFLGMAAATLVDYRMPLLMSVLTGFAAVMLSLFIKEGETRRREPVSVPELLKVFRDRTVLIPALFAVVVQMLGQGTAFSFTSDAARSIGGNAVEIGTASCLFTASQIVTAVFLRGHFAQKQKTHHMAAAGFLLYTAYCLMIGLTGTMWLIYPAQIIGGVGNAVLTSVLMAACIRYVRPEKKSTAMGFYQAVYGLGMTAGPIIMGYFVEYGGYKGGFGIFALFAAAAAVCALIVIPKAQPETDRKVKEE